MTTSVDIALRWGDMDAYRHVNNVTYLKYLEEARVVAFDRWFEGRDVVQHGVIVARSEIEYVRPLEYRRAPAQVDVWVIAVKGASFDLDYVVRDPQDVGDTVYAKATTTMVMFDLATGTPRKIDDETRALLTAQLADPVDLRSRR